MEEDIMVYLNYNKPNTVVTNENNVKTNMENKKTDNEKNKENKENAMTEQESGGSVVKSLSQRLKLH